MTVPIPSPCTHLARSSDNRDAAVAFLLSRINYERAPVVPYSERTLKLARMRDLLSRLGRPGADIPIVHVAGTKGKGSTAAMIESVLTAAGYRAGLFSSPHLDQIEERFCIEGRPCDGATLADLVDRLRPVVAAMDAAASPGDSGPTYFELTTAIALLHFAEHEVDVAVLEVGLGGRLDSTNVCEPAVCVITNISLDHTEQLGKSLTAIAREKAGIIKPGVPVVSGVLDQAPKAVIAKRAQQLGAPLIQLDEDFSFRYTPPEYDGQPGTIGRLDYIESKIDESPEVKGEGLRVGSKISEVCLPVLGQHQAANAAVAISVARQLTRHGWSIPTDAIHRGLAAVRLPARIEVLGHRPTVIVDAAHNVASAVALVDAIRAIAISGTRTVLLAATIGKDVRGILEVVLPHFDRIVVTQYQNNTRAMPAEELATTLRQVWPKERTDWANAVFIHPTPPDAWRFVKKTSGKDDLICSTGSFFLAAEIRALALSDAAQC